MRAHRRRKISLQLLTKRLVQQLADELDTDDSGKVEADEVLEAAFRLLETAMSIEKRIGPLIDRADASNRHDRRAKEA